jgi:Zn-dependent M28 family amino/carboxypeptidase
MFRFLFSFVVSISLFGQTLGIEGERLRAHVRFLASDDLEGRSVGTRAERLTTEYLAAAFRAAGAQPGGENGTYFQRVPLAGVTTLDRSQLSIGGRAVAMRSGWIATAYSQEESVKLEADMVFVGHGIVAPEYGWNDYAGVDVKGKVVLLFTGEPPSEDEGFFAGKGLTYYGRWTYKMEEATRQGAAGVLILHTNATASYGWDVVRNSWGREDVQVRRATGAAALRLAGWITEAEGERIAAAAGSSVSQMLASADQRGFQARALPVKAKADLALAVRPIESRNVAAKVEGSDARLKEEYVLYSAHWDHLGVATEGAGDRIYNGAVDNGTGCAMLIEMARAWAALPVKPKRSVLFLAVTAEESGLRGSSYYAQSPLVPVAQSVAALNFDAIVPGGKPKGLVATGAEKTKAWPLVQEAARRFGMEILGDPRPEAGSYFRSDHFSFAKAGIAAFSLQAAGVPGDFAQSYGAQRYHQVSDEYSEDWDMTSIEWMSRFGFVLGTNLANR